ncbi:MAG: TetR/AcrR family transcriptional regulator [Proteobacteria bacterium]|nr:TetR/AcrR family transcriptional regulator [Pseudomonadota bacterium]
MPTSITPSTDIAARRPRKRLTPDTRIPLILDAALAEFSAHGYSATRIDDIANRAGLSKGGFYAHFSGKDAVFEALLRRSLTAPTLDVDALLDAATDIRGLVEQLVDQLHTHLGDTTLRATARLLLTDGHRLPDVVTLWRQNTVDNLHVQLGALLRRCVERGLCRDSTVVHHPWLIVSPVIHQLFQQLSSAAVVPIQLREARSTHVDMLCELLTPHPQAA